MDEPRSAQRYLEDLTPGGSEYFNNPKRCYEWAYGRIEGAHRIALDAALERNKQTERAMKAEAEVERLRARTHELQERHDKDTAQLRRDLARYRDLWGRAGEALNEHGPGYLVAPSATQRAVWGIMVDRAEQAEAEVERLLAALRKARGFASIVDDKIMGPLPDDTRWAIKDLARIQREDIDTALGSE